MKVLELSGRGRQAFFSTFNSPFRRVKEDGEHHHSQREPLGQHMPEGWCPSQLRWVSCPRPLSYRAAPLPLHLHWISCSTELLSVSVDHPCAILARCGGDHFGQYWGMYSFPFSWAHTFCSFFPGSLHHTGHPFDHCCCSTPAAEPP